MNNIHNPFSLKGKLILVTGASSGIGKECAIQCAKMGATLIITGRNEERLKNTFDELEGSNHLYVTADINNSVERSLILDKIEKIDGILHSAGIMGTLPFKFITSEKIDAMMKTNFYSPMLLTKELLSSKKINKGASIVFISSLGAKHSGRGNGLYAASKGALNSLARMIALEVSVQRIRVNCILPGMIHSGVEHAMSLSQHDIEMDEAKYPFGYGKPDDVAYASIYLLSDASKWVTGLELVMDGGLLL